MVHQEENYVKNAFGIDIKVCCASCKFKDYKNDKERICKLSNTTTHPSEYCSTWKMGEHLEKAGMGGGRVKKKAWLDYVYQNGKSQAAQMEFERKNKSIYLDGRRSLNY